MHPMASAGTALRSGSTHGWAHLAEERKRDLIGAVLGGGATRGPAHLELDLTDRCNIACYFCNQQDTRSKLQLPLERVLGLIDELAGRGLASVRLSGGGDPLHHREILPILDHLAACRVVVDNLTTNAVSLTPEVAERLVRHQAREVNVSLNAVDGEDYRRMMAVKPALFERVLDNTRHLLARRGEGARPLVSVQFLLDRANAGRVLEMHELAESLACDRIIVSAVQQIANDRIEPDRLLSRADAERLRPLFVELFRRADPERLEVNLASQGLRAMVDAAREEAGARFAPPFPTAPSFREEDGGCFFGWYSAAVTGTGDVYPCCQLIQPGGTVFGNLLRESVDEVWHGERFRTLRAEMREVVIEGNQRHYPAERFRILPSVCHRPGACWLKNVYFRADEGFYRELHAALEVERKRRARLEALRGLVRPVLARFPRLVPAWDRLREATRPARRWLRRRLGVVLTESG